MKKIAVPRWGDIVHVLKAILLFIPNLIHDLVVPPEEGDEGSHMMTWEFGQAVKHMPQLLRSLAFKTRTLEEQLHQSMLRGNLRRTFSLFDLLMIGIGITIGSGVFMLTGISQGAYAGSATFLGYLLLAIPLLCAAACYAELCVEYPVSGSAFTYVLATLGEYPAFLTLGFLILEYLLAMAAVARGFSTFFALLCNQPHDVFLIEANGTIEVDVMAMAIVIIVTVALCFGIRESSMLLTAANITGLFFLLFIGISGFTQASSSVFSEGFLIDGIGWDGLFQAFAVLMFSYVGFDAVCNAVEETRDIKDTPKALLGTIGISAIVYAFMALCLAFLVTPEQLNLCTNQVGDQVETNECRPPNALAYASAFTFAFNMVGLPWMQYIIALGALFTISTTLLVGLYSLGRIVMVGAREWLLPPVLSNISSRTQTPLVAQTVVGILVALISFLFAYGNLSEIVSCGSLMIIVMVCNSFLSRRYYPDVKLRYTQYGTVEATPMHHRTDKYRIKMGKQVHRLVVWLHILLIDAISIGFGVFYRLSGQNAREISTEETFEGPTSTVYSSNSIYSLYFVVVWFVVTVSMWYFCSIQYYPETWYIPWYLLPWLPSFAILIVIFVAANLEVLAYWYSLAFFLGLTLIYLFISMPLSYIRRLHYSRKGEDARVIELVFKDGKWQPLDVLTSHYSQTELSSTRWHESGNTSIYFPSVFSKAFHGPGFLRSSGDTIFEDEPNHGSPQKKEARNSE